MDREGYEKEIEPLVRELREKCKEFKVPLLIACHIDIDKESCANVLTTIWKNDWHVPVEYNLAIGLLTARLTPLSVSLIEAIAASRQGFGEIPVPKKEEDEEETVH